MTFFSGRDILRDGRPKITTMTLSIMVVGQAAAAEAAGRTQRRV